MPKLVTTTIQPHTISKGCWRPATFDGDKHISNRSNRHGYPKTRRKSNRLRTVGIVALESLGEPVVTNIYDIAPGGVSFLHDSEIVGTDSEFNIDILIYDNQSNFEYFIPQVKVRTISATLVSYPKSNKQVWRYGIEFLDLVCAKKNLLLTFFSMRQSFVQPPAKLQRLEDIGWPGYNKTG